MEMSNNMEKTRVGISTQTSVGVAATTGGHGEGTPSLRVASGYDGSSAAMQEAGRSSDSVTATTSDAVKHPSRVKEVIDGKGANKRDTMDAEIESDSDHSVKTLNTLDEEELLKSPMAGEDASRLSTTRSKPTKEGRRALKQYKAAVRLVDTLGNKESCSKEEQERLAWAKSTVEKGRQHFERRQKFSAREPNFCNVVEEGVLKKLAEKRQRSSDEIKSETTKRPKTNTPTTERAPAINTKAPTASEIAKKHLTVALIDRADPNGKMSLQRWKKVEMMLLDKMVEYMNINPNLPMPSFDGAGWFSDVKIIKCNDELTLGWCKRTIGSLHDLWEGAKLEIVAKADIPSAPKAKVTIPRIVPADTALRLLQRQNPDIPTDDWKVLKVDKPPKTEGGQNYVLLINNAAEDLLYPRFGKMAWGVGSVFLRLKKRHAKDGNTNTLLAGEVEKDLGLDTLTEAATKMTIEEGEGSGLVASTAEAPEPSASQDANHTD